MHLDEEFAARSFFRRRVAQGMLTASLISTIIGTLLPPSAAKTVFSKSIKIGLDTTKIDFYAISLTFGLMFKINFMSALSMLLVVFYFRFWYI